MDTITIHAKNNSCTVNEAMNILFSKLDEAINDMEEREYFYCKRVINESIWKRIVTEKDCR